MPAPQTIEPFFLERFKKIRELLDILSALRDLTEPLTTAQGLRQTIELLARVARLVGVDPAWIERLLSILDDQATFRVVLAIVNFVLNSIARKAEGGAVRIALAEDDDVHLTAHAFTDWLPLVMQIINLLRQLRTQA